MRRFCSYGPVNTKLHYYVPRQALVDFACQQLLGENPEKGGHYITVWAPRQRGKTWVMQQVLQRLHTRDDFEVAYLVLQDAKDVHTEEAALEVLFNNLRRGFQRDFPPLTKWRDFATLFTTQYFDKPVILILDEFDALPEAAIQSCVNILRKIYIEQLTPRPHPDSERPYLLHGLALIGVRAVLGVENTSGSPFNVQRGMHIPNLTEAEVNEMYHWYERESGQPVEQAVIDRVFYETQGQPGLVSWLGELLTETYNATPTQPLTLQHFENVYGRAVNVLPNSNLLNIVSKARQEPYRETVLELFRTRKETAFRYEDPRLNFLYLNGVIDWTEVSSDEYYIKFPSPFVQKRLFHAFAGDIAPDSGRLYDPFADLSDTITDDTLYVPALLRRAETYFRENSHWLFKNAPRRADLRLYEAVYHFNLYTYLRDFLQDWEGQVTPEFPTGNGADCSSPKVDLIIRYAGRVYALEVKSFSNAPLYREALVQAARYAQQLGLTDITLALFIDTPVDDANRAKYEAVYTDAATGVTVRPVFVEIEA